MCDGAPRQWTADEADAARAGRRAHAVRGRERARGGGAARESRRAVAGDAARRRWARGRATWSLTRCGGAPSSPRLFGLSPDDIDYSRERLFAQIMPEDRAAAARRRSKTALDRHEDYAVEFEFQHAPGEWRWMEGARQGDLRRRRQAADAVRARHRHHRSASRGRGAAGSRSPQGRIPRHARARASQPAGADQLGPPHPAHAERRPAGGRQRARDHGAAGRARWCGWSTTCSTSRASRPARWSCSASRSISPRRFSDAVETSGPLLDAGRPVASTMTLPATPVYVNADRTRLAQVFANLLNNSAKYSEPRTADLRSPSRATAAQAVVRVRDAGIGIHPRDAAAACSRCSGRPIAPARARAAASASASCS